MSTKRSFSTTGKSATYYSSTAISNLNVEQTIISEVIPGNALSSYRPFNFDIVFDLSTPLIPPLLTVKIKLGNQSFTILSSLGLTSSLVSKKFKIKGQIIAVSDDLQTHFLDAETRQNGLLTGLLSGLNQAFSDLTVDGTIDQTFSITVQTNSLVSGTNIILKKAIIGML